MFLLTALFFALISGAVHAQAGANDPTFNPVDVGFDYGAGIVGSGVNAIAVQPDGRILIGGYFSAYNGTTCNHIARLNADGSLDTDFAPGSPANGGFSHSVNAITLYPADAGPGLSGKILIGGGFTEYDGTARNAIARLNADGSLDTGFDPIFGADGVVHAITIQSDGKILIGGEFTAYDGTARNRIARLNVDGSLDVGFDPGTGVANVWGGSIVRSIAIYPPEASPDLAGKVLIGGGFTEYNGTSRNDIARLNADGSVDTDFEPGQEMQYGVSSIVLQPDGRLLAGGNTNLARLNTDGSVDPSFTFTGSSIRAIVLQPDGKVLVGQMGFGDNVSRLQSDGSLDTSAFVFAGLTTWVQAIALQPDGRVLIGGNFGYVDGVLVRGVARLDTVLNADLAFNPGTGADGRVEALATLADGKVLVGGAFTRYNGTPSRCLARLNENGSLDPTFLASGLRGDGSFDSYMLAVHAIAVHHPNMDPALAGKIHVGGYFSNYDGVPRNGIAQLHADGSLDLDFDPGTGVMNDLERGDVKAMAIYPPNADPELAGKILIGGVFTEYDGTPRNHIARLNVDGSLDPVFDPGMGPATDWDDSEVRTIAIYSPDAGPALAGKILIGGRFTEYDGTPRNNIARLNADGSLDTGFDPGTGTDGGFDPGVHAITIYPPDAGSVLAGKILIVGGFTEYDGTPRNGIARLNVDGSLDLDFDPGTGANEPVLAVAVQQAEGKILIGGWFSTYTGTPRNGIARLNTDGSMDGSFNPGTGADGPVHTVALGSNGRALIGGEFTSYNGTGRNRLARLLGGDNDCTGTVGGTALPGTPCNDSDPCTVNDAWDLSCNCVGETIPATTWPPFDTLCVSGAPYVLDHPSAPPGGIWSGPGVEDNVFLPSLVGSGSFTLTYAGGDPCIVAQAAIEVIDEPNIDVVSGQPGGCNLEPVVLAAQPSGGTWGGLADATGRVDQSCAVRPIGGNAIYTYSAPNGDCSASAFGSIFLNACAGAAALGPDTVLCSNDEYLLSWTYNGVGNTFTNITGADSSITSGPGGSTTWFFSPYQKTAGTYTITSWSTSSSPFTCPNTDTLLVTVLDPPIISIGTHGPLCSNDAPIVLTGSPTGGTWSGLGVSGGQFDPAAVGAGIWTVTYTVSEGICSNTDSTAIVVDQAPNAGLSGALNLCSTNAPVGLINALSGSPQADGTWSGPSPTTGIYFPGTMEPGIYTYTVSGSGACPNATATVLVTEQPTPNAGVSSSVNVCSDSAPIDMRLALAGSPDQNGTWSGPSPTSGFFDPATMTPGIYTYTVSGPIPCTDASATLTITVITAPNAGVSDTVEVCAGGAPFTLFPLLGGTPQAGGTWTFQGMASSGVFDPLVSEEGIYTYTVWGTVPCANASAQLVVNVIDLQLQYIDGITYIGDVEPLTYSALPFLADADSFSWSIPEGWTYATPYSTSGTVVLLPPEQETNATICVRAYGGGCTGNEVCLTPISVGIAHWESEAPFHLVAFPNPSNGSFTVQVTGIFDPLHARILNTVGQKVAEFTLGMGKPSVDLERFSSGTYVLHWTSGGYHGVERIVVTR